MAAPSFGSISALAEIYGSSTLAIPVPAGTVAGSVLLAFLEKELVDAVEGPPPGFAELGTGVSATGLEQHIFWKRATEADSGTYLFDWGTTAPYAAGRVMRVTGTGATGSPFDGSPSTGTRSTTNSGATPNVSKTTTGTDRLMVWAGTNLDGGMWTPPSGYTLRSGSIYTTLAIATAVQSTAGSSGNLSGSCDNPEVSTAMLIALHDQAGGGPAASPKGLLPILMS